MRLGGSRYVMICVKTFWGFKIVWLWRKKGDSAALVRGLIVEHISPADFKIPFLLTKGAIVREDFSNCLTQGITNELTPPIASSALALWSKHSDCL